MSVYENRFKKLLIEKDEEMSDDQTAMAQTLDKGTEVSDFDVQAPEAGAQAQPTMSAIQKLMYDELNTWILRLDEFKEFLNGTGQESVQSRLNSAEPETIINRYIAATSSRDTPHGA